MGLILGLAGYALPLYVLYLNIAGVVDLTTKNGAEGFFTGLLAFGISFGIFALIFNLLTNPFRTSANAAALGSKTGFFIAGAIITVALIAGMRLVSLAVNITGAEVNFLFH